MSTRWKTLLFGGGGVHDHKAICPVLNEYLGGAGGFDVDHVVEDYDAFLEERLDPYDLVIVYHTGHNLTPEQATGLTRAIAKGKGYVGIHGAADSFKGSPEYLAMIGGVFKAHPFKRDYLVSLVDPTPGINNGLEHPAVASFTGYTVEHWEKWPVFEYMVHDEQYLLDYDPRNNILATALYKGKAWPVAWTKPWHQGRVFYLALGHDYQATQNPFFRELFVAGSQWAAEPPPPPEK